MSNWIEISAEDLNDYKVGALMDALRNQALADGQSDPFDSVVADVVSHVRRKVAANSRNRLDRNLGKIPKGLKAIGCRAVIAAMKSRLEISLTKDEADQAIRDARDLDRIADGADPVDVADNPETSIEVRPATSVAAEQVSGSKRHLTRQSLRGL